MNKTFLLFLTCLLNGAILFSQFGPQQIVGSNLPANTSVYFVDLNGDNAVDILSASETDNKIVWYENLGGNAFSAEQLISNNVGGPVSVFAVDLDGDNDNDVLSANYNDSTVTWFENLGGSFSPKNILNSNAIGAKSVYAIDLDADNDQDVISASFLDGKVAWYENLGSGTFAAEQLLTGFTGSPGQVFSIDLDNDTDPDILIADWLNDVTWIENLGGGTFGSEQIIGSLFYLDDVYAGDLDNDGDADVIAAGTYQTISVFENQGSGNFGSALVVTDSAGGARNIYTFDIDGDNFLDIIAAERSFNRLTWYKNLGGLSFGPPNSIVDVPGSDNMRDLYAADTDGDGDLDLTAAYYTSNEVVFFENLSGPVSVNENEATQLNLRVYPNPTQNSFTIAFEKTLDEVHVSITNANGQVLQSITAKDCLSIEMEMDYAPTVYFIHVTSEEINTVLRLIKD
jgi:hypothetical protein